MLVGKTGFGPSCKQDDINALMVSLAKQGKRVVRLKGGDPLIFGRAGRGDRGLPGGRHRGRRRARHHRGAGRGEPGSAFRSTDRTHARRLQYVTGHAHRRPAAGRSRLAEPRRSGRPPPRSTCRRARWRRWSPRRTAEGLDPQTPALAIARATRPDQAVVTAPIGELPDASCAAALPGPLLVMLGRVFCEQAGAQGQRRARDQKAG